MSEETPFIDIHWIEFYGGLSRNNILEYFYSSPFFDSTSDNQVLRIQGVSPDNLIDMIGMQYIIDLQNLSEPDLFIIKQIKRKDKNTIDVLAVYYCFQGTIYKGPNMLDLLKSRITKSTYYLLQSFIEVSETTSFDIQGHKIWTTDSNVAKNEPYSLPNYGDKYILRDFPSMESVANDMTRENFFSK